MNKLLIYKNTLCDVRPIFYGEFASGFSLFRARVSDMTIKANQWGIIECARPCVVFDTEPIIYDDPNLTKLAYENFYSEIYMPMSVAGRLLTALEHANIPYRVKRQWVKHHIYSPEHMFYYYLADFIKTTEPKDFYYG